MCLGNKADLLVHPSFAGQGSPQAFTHPNPLSIVADNDLEMKENQYPSFAFLKMSLMLLSVKQRLYSIAFSANIEQFQ